MAGYGSGDGFRGGNSLRRRRWHRQVWMLHSVRDDKIRLWRFNQGSHGRGRPGLRSGATVVTLVLRRRFCWRTRILARRTI